MTAVPVCMSHVLFGSIIGPAFGVALARLRGERQPPTLAVTASAGQG